jgi:transposase-like protein
MGSRSSRVPPSLPSDKTLTTPGLTMARATEEADRSVTVTRLGPEVAQRVFPRQRALTDEQEQALTHLYAETDTPLSEIARTYGIGQASVYRVVKRRGAALRGRVSRDRGGPTSEVPSMPPSPAARRLAPAPASGGTQLGARPARLREQARHRFQVTYLLERVVAAEDVHDAIRQLEAIGVTEIRAIVRED